MKSRERRYLKYRRDQKDMARIGVGYSARRYKAGPCKKYFSRPKKKWRTYNYLKAGSIINVMTPIGKSGMMVMPTRLKKDMLIKTQKPCQQ